MECDREVPTDAGSGLAASRLDPAGLSQPKANLCFPGARSQSPSKADLKVRAKYFGIRQPGSFKKKLKFCLNKTIQVLLWYR